MKSLRNRAGGGRRWRSWPRRRWPQTSISTTTRPTGRTPSRGPQQGPGGRRETVPYADTSTYQAAVRAALRTPSAPGVFTWWSGYRMKDLVDAGLVADVSDLWKKYTDAGLYSPSLASAYTFDGKIYGIPNLVAYWVGLLQQEGLRRDSGLTPPKTWAELEAAAAKLKGAGITPFGATVEGRWPAFIWFQEFLDPPATRTSTTKLMNGEAKYTDPEVTEVFKTWKDWIDKGYFTDPSIAFGTAGANAMASEFAKGNLAMILVGTWYAATLTGGGHDEPRTSASSSCPTRTPAWRRR